MISLISANTSIDKFYGLNLNETGDTQLALGESGKMSNFRITKDNKLEKMYGYSDKYTKSNEIRAIWVGNLNGTDVFVYVCGGKVYNDTTELGSLTDDITSIFEFNKKLYFINGHEYKSWDGTTFEEVNGYIPKVMTSTLPNGEGMKLEPINALTGKKHQTFSPDGTSTEFILHESGLDSIDYVYINGVETTATYTKDLTNGKLNFSTAPTEGTNSMDVYWTKGIGERLTVTNNKYFRLYGLASDTRVFLYGDATAKNRIRFSELGNGLPSAEYFPGNNTIDIGSSNEPVTDMSRQYDTLVITKPRESYYATYTQITDTEGNQIITFPAYPLNDSHGATPYAQSQVLDNYVTTIDSSIVQWMSTQTKDERNAQVISTKIQEWLNSKDLSKAVTMDYQTEKEYWVAVDDECMVYNYSNGCFYLLKFPIKMKCFYVNDDVIYAGTEEGKIIEFGTNKTTYGSTAIKAEWQSGYYDFGTEERRKTMRVLWLTLKPHSKTSVDINYISDRDSGAESKEIENRCIDYDFWKYGDMTYNTQRSVKPFRIKLKAKKFAFLKLILKNEKSDERLTINSIAIKRAIGGEVK